eukprot:jgi/Botrbrau1/11210/Bobra.0075s0006.1
MSQSIQRALSVSTNGAAHVELPPSLGHLTVCVLRPAPAKCTTDGCGGISFSGPLDETYRSMRMLVHVCCTCMRSSRSEKKTLGTRNTEMS